MRRYRVTVEVELPDDASADEALVWAAKILSIGEAHWSEHHSESDRVEYRVVSASPVRSVL